MDTLLGLELAPLSSFCEESIVDIIRDAYSLFPSIIERTDCFSLYKDISSDTSNIDGFVASLDNIPIGVIVWQTQDDYATLLEFAVCTSYQNKGYGSIMLVETINLLSSLGIKKIKATAYQRLLTASHLLDKHNFCFVSLSRLTDLSLGLGALVNYLHIIGKKLPRPKKQRKKLNIFN